MSDENENNQPESRRDALMASLEAAEAGTLGQTSEAPIESSTSSDRPRDEAGRFAPKAADRADGMNLNNEGDPITSNAAPTASDQTTQPATSEPAPRLTTWKRDMLALHDKLAAGQPLTAEEAQKLAAYNVQREKEYTTGVSTYKSEAQQAKQFTEAIAEFMPTLQQHGLNPAQWIQNLGRAHHTLALGTPEQKLEMFTRLAQDYGVPLAAVQQAQSGQVDPLAMQLMQQLQQVNQRIQGITSWREQQEQQAIQQELSKFSDAERYPHFEQVRESMAQLLERGLAQNPDDAYAKAVRLDDSLFAQEQQRQAAAQAASSAQSRQAAVAKAKSAAVSVRSATPSGVTSNSAPKDRRSALAEAFESADSGRV